MWISFRIRNLCTSRALQRCLLPLCILGTRKEVEEERGTGSETETTGEGITTTAGTVTIEAAGGTTTVATRGDTNTGRTGMYVLSNVNVGGQDVVFKCMVRVSDFDLFYIF